MAAVDQIRANPASRTEIYQKEPPQEGWVPITMLVNESGRLHNVLTDWARQESEGLPETIRKFYDADVKHDVLHLSPELAQRVRERIARTPLVRRVKATGQE